MVKQGKMVGEIEGEEKKERRGRGEGRGGEGNGGEGGGTCTYHQSSLRHI